ncbi:MAG TPA: FG-GAP-like repeat-containing protein [Pyrinomonadaceae bacterium]|nr:FG-GAP-like repeat-containing protein [Pyrinomonadaceae bacterium]
MAAAILLPLMHARTASAQCKKNSRALRQSKTNLQTLKQKRGARAGAARKASPRPTKASALAAAGACATPFTEAAGSPVLVGDSPLKAAVADFDGDGKLDMATANSFSDDVTILLGNGTGAFTEAAGSPVTVGTSPVSVAAADFDNDGDQDLAVANIDDDTVTILLGDGAGGFTEAANSPFNAGPGPASVVTGDFNNDGRQDLATANAGCTDVTILLGDGAGDFSEAAGSPVTVGITPVSITLADFNKDGKADLATANVDGDDVTILLGDGAGGFTATATSPTAGSSPASIAAGDFNNDGKADLAVGNDNDGDVTILLGDGSGGFAEPAGSPVWVGFGVSVAVLDFNNDGRQDLAAASLAFSDVTILLGDGAGGFTESPGSPVPVGDGPFTVAVGDFNRDGRPDIATPNAGCSDVTVLLNTCDRDCQGANFFEAAGSPIALQVTGEPTRVAVGDFNNDGRPDLAVTSVLNELFILLGDGAGGFTEAAGSPVATGNSSFPVVVADFDNDGKQDLAVGNYGESSLTILLGDGTGGFTEAAGSPIAGVVSPLGLATGDFNRDGNQDLAAANDASDSVTILLGDGTGGFKPPVGLPVTVGDSPKSVTAGDFNNDGKTDLATANANSNDLTILIGDGAGGFSQPAGSPVAAGGSPEDVVAADFNRDGNLDLAATVSPEHVVILLGDGAGGFTEHAGSPVALGEYFFALAAGDFNNDGKTDLAASGNAAGNVSFLLGNGAGGFTQTAGSPVKAGLDPFDVAAGDFNNDGRLDLVTPNNGSRDVTVLLNACPVDLSITKKDTPDPVLAGNQVTYDLTVTNLSAKTAPGVVVTDQLAASTTFVSAAPSQGSCTGTTLITCDLGDIAGGGSATVRIVARTTVPGPAANTAVVKSALPDPDRSNNADRAPTSVFGLKSLSLSPALLTGGCWNSRYTATITLTEPAPAGGVLVQLSDDAAKVNTPAAVKIEKGKTTVTFSGAVGMGTSVREVTFTATAGATTVKKKLTVTPVRIVSLSLSTSTVKGGNSVTGNLSLTCSPTSDVVVTLTSGRWAAWLPAVQLTVPAGHSTGQFTVNTLKVTSPVDALITASANGAAKSATLHIVP